MNTVGLTDGTLLAETLAAIVPTDSEVSRYLSADFKRRTNVPDEAGLGCLSDLLIKYGTILNNNSSKNDTSMSIDLPDVNPATIICCADHGVAKMNVSAYPQETTLNMTANYLISRGAAANAFANLINSQMFVADMGINAETKDLPDIIYYKIAYGTANSAKGPAMTREQAITALEIGISIAEQCAAGGINVILPGEMGISNTTSSAAIIAAICGLTPEQATGRGTNISDERLANKRRIVEQIINVNKPDPADGIDVLAKVGGFELGAIAGIILGAAKNKVMVILDGLNTSAAALIAATISPAVTDYLAASHLAGEPAQYFALKKLNLKPYMKLDLRLGEAIGSSLACDLLDMTIKGYRELFKSDVEQGMLFTQIRHENLPSKSVTLSDKTFNYYTNTMPDLDREVMERCQFRLDNLAKPIHSLGHIEKIALELAGILERELPDMDTRKALLCIGMDPVDEDILKKMEDAVLNGNSTIPDVLIEAFGADAANSDETNLQSISVETCTLANAFAQQSNAKFALAHLTLKHSQDDYFEFGRSLGEKYSINTDVLGVALTAEHDSPAKHITPALVDGDGNLKYTATEFLSHVPEFYRPHVSTLLGVILAAAHNHTMIILDDYATVTVARYAVELFPDLQPFILPIQPTLYQTGINCGGGLIAAMGLRLVDAALHTINDMKTFAEAQVAVANDGPGAGRQI